MPEAPRTPETTANEARDVEQANPPDGWPRRQRSTLPSFLFLSFIFFMLTNNQNEELAVRNQYLDTLSVLNYQLSNFSAWRNGTESNFTLPPADMTISPLLERFMSFGPRLYPQLGSYYTNLTGYWKGDARFHNLTQDSHPSAAADGPLSSLLWANLASDYLAGANLTNATELVERLGVWNWTRSEKVDISFGDKLVWNLKNRTEVSRDVAMIHGKIDFSDSKSTDEFRLELDGVHFVSNGSIYAYAVPSGHGIDIRTLPSLVPRDYMNETAIVVEEELVTRIAKLKERIDLGTIVENANDEGPKSDCIFQFYAQEEGTDVPQDLLKDLEEEIDHPTGISTVRQPKMKFKGVLMSKNCAILYELSEITGMKSNTLYRKISTYSGISTLIYGTLLVLFFRQTSQSNSVTGLSRVSRYPFIIQSLIDAVSFVGHVTLGIIADGRTSISVMAPAALACILFVQEAQYAVLIGQLQAPEDVRPQPPPPPPAPSPAVPPPTMVPSIPPLSVPSEIEETDSQTVPLLPSIASSPSTPTVAGLAVQTSTESPAQAAPAVPPTTTVTPASGQPSVFSILWNHFRNDPSARLWAFMCFFLLVVLRVVLAFSLPFIFIGGLYAFLWTLQIYRAVRRGRTSGLTAEYIVGTSVCRLFYLMYFMLCPNNILDIEPRQWTYAVVGVLLAQVALIVLQERFGASFFLPRGFGSAELYDYHPPIPLPDAEAPDQSLGDCAICMEAILVDPVLRQQQRHGSGEEKVRRTGAALFAQGARKGYSLAPCHHLFHTTCLERWIAIKNICPQCRRPLPPL